MLLIKLLAWFNTLRYRHFAVLLVLGVLLGAIVLGGYEPELPALNTRKVVVSGNEPAPVSALPKLVATYRDVPPDMVTYSKDRHSGPLRFVTEEAARRIGYAIEWKDASFSHSVTDLGEGTVDIVPYVFSRTAEREKDSRFSVSLGVRPRPVYFIVRKLGGRSIAISKIEDLSNYSVGFRDRSFYFAEFHTLTGIRKVPYEDDAAMMKGFVSGEVDVILVNNRKSTERALISAGYNDYEYAELVIEKVSDMYYLYTRNPKHEKTFEQFDRALEDMKKEGLIKAIYASFDADPPK